MSRSRTRIPVAIAHDYLTQRGGAERVVLALSRVFPDAPIYTTLYDPEGTFPEFREHRIVTSPLNAITRFREDHRLALPLLAPAASGMRIPADVVVASSSGWAHGFKGSGKMLVYCHNPARWLYQRDEYLGEHGPLSIRRAVLRALGPGLRRWDQLAARRSHRYLANSAVVRERIASTYGILADVVPPPPGIDQLGDQEAHPEVVDWESSDFWLLVSRLLPYKNVDLAVEAFRGRPDRLVVVGEGPEKASLLASVPPNVRILSGISDAELRWLYARARGLIAPSLEDFGLTPLEANSWGIPVVARRGGGYLETVVEGWTGVFFDTLEPHALGRAVDEAALNHWDPGSLREHSRRFGEERFAERIRAEVDALRKS